MKEGDFCGRARADVYEVRHVSGAVNYSLGDFEKQSAELKSRAALDRQIIVYCGSETCGLADRIARQLTERGLPMSQCLRKGGRRGRQLSDGAVMGTSAATPCVPPFQGKKGFEVI